MGGDPDLITEEMRPVNAQSFGLIYTSPLMLLTHRLTTEEFYKSKCSPSSFESLLLSVQLHSKLLHKSAIMMLDCLGSQWQLVMIRKYYLQNEKKTAKVVL